MKKETISNFSSHFLLALFISFVSIILFAATSYSYGSAGTLKWRYKADYEIYSSPAIGPDGTVYVGSEDDCLYAINPDGTLKWRYKTGSGIGSSPAIGADGTVYVGSWDGYLYAINPDGTLKWRYGTDNRIGSSPAIGPDGTVYVGSNDGCLYAINSDGTLKWRYKIDYYYGINSSPAIGADGTVYVGSEDDCLYAINPDGTLKWRYKTGSGIGSFPAIGADGTVYVGSWDHYLYAINPDGALKWRYKADYEINSSPAIGLDGTVYVGSEDDCLYAINPDGTLKWRYKTGNGINSSPAIGADGTVYVGSHDDCLYAINLDGTLRWRYKTDYWINSSPAIGADGTVYVGSDDHYLYAINGDSGGLANSPWPKFHYDNRNTGHTATGYWHPVIQIPVISDFSVSPGSIVLNGGTFTISYMVSDTSGSGLNRVELWRARDDNNNNRPDDSEWKKIGSPRSLSGNSPISGSFSDSPSSPGTYWYDVHVVDNDGHCVCEPDEPPLGPVEVTVPLTANNHAGYPPEPLDALPLNMGPLNLTVNPATNTIAVLPSEITIQPSMSIPEKDQGQQAQLLMYIYLPSYDTGLPLFYGPTVTLSNIVSFDSFFPDPIDCSTCSGLIADIYYGYSLPGGDIKYNAYELKIIQ